MSDTRDLERALESLSEQAKKLEEERKEGEEKTDEQLAAEFLLKINGWG